MAETTQGKPKKTSNLGCTVVFIILFLMILSALSAESPTDSEREADLEEFQQNYRDYQQDQETYDTLKDFEYYIESNQ